MSDILRHIIRKTLFEAVTFDNNKTFSPPPGVQQAARNASKSGNKTSGGGNEGNGLEKAVDLAAGTLQNHAQMKRMKAFFDGNAEKVSQEKLAGKTAANSPLIQSWELHGGDAGRAWVDQQLASVNKSNLNTKKNLRAAGGAGTNKGMGTFDTSIMDTTKQRNHSVVTQIKNKK